MDADGLPGFNDRLIDGRGEVWTLGSRYPFALIRARDQKIVRLSTEVFSEMVEVFKIVEGRMVWEGLPDPALPAVARPAGGGA